MVARLTHSHLFPFSRQRSRELKWEEEQAMQITCLCMLSP